VYGQFFVEIRATKGEKLDGRAQTGALVSRLNNDVTAARTAFTDILLNVAGNLITVGLILGAMVVFSWRITLAALVLPPLFLVCGDELASKLKHEHFAFPDCYEF
jgi:ABC-type multidrug transport system fused ATPase/permease subunit